MRDILENNKMKIYVHEDHMEQGNIYMKHLSAMTKEQLHSKADIAGELAGRDIVITKLAKALEEAITYIDELSHCEGIDRDVSKELQNISLVVSSRLHEQDLTIYKADSLEYDK